MERTINMKLEERLEGAIGERGKFTGYLPNGKKGATYQYQHINFEDHFTGFEYYGLSPVKIIQNGTGRKGVCRWIAWDLDVEATPEDFCRIVFKINTEFVISVEEGEHRSPHSATRIEQALQALQVLAQDA